MLDGLLNLPWWGDVIVLLVLTHITIVSVTLFLHRSQAHFALKLHPILSHFFRLWLWLTTGMETKIWVAVHRKHHVHCERPDDPHSPQILGLPKVLWQGAELYRKEGKNKETLERYGKGTPDDWLERHIYTPHSAKGVLITLAVDLILFGIPGLTIWGIQMFWIPFFAAGVINGVAHFSGYRNFECPDEARNLLPLAILIGGEELHNNHHTYPRSAKFSVKWWEFDIGWLYIQLFSLLGLAKVNSLAPKPQLCSAKLKVDLDTLKSVFANRFQILAQYTNTVIIPTFKEEQSNIKVIGKPLFRKAKALLVRERQLIVNENDQKCLQTVLNHSDKLDMVYQFRSKLQQLWSKHATMAADSSKELVIALQEWCKQAENTGLQSLREFVVYLRRYSVA